MKSMLRRCGEFVFLLVCMLTMQQVASASPFGQGVFGADVPFGSATSLAIALGGNVSLTLAPNGSNFSASGSHTVTVTSTDVVGYDLYAYSANGTSMTGATTSIPASANGAPAPLAVNSWGYNTDGSSNFVGMRSTPTRIHTANGPYKNGDATAVTYGVLTDITTGAGQYDVSVVYTAVARSQ